MATEWKFITPSKHYTFFYLVSTGGSARYNYLQVWVGSGLADYFPILPTNGWLQRYNPEPNPKEYSLRPFAQIPGTNTVTASNISATQVQPGNPGDQEWILHIQGDEGVELQVALVLSLNEQKREEPMGDGRIVYSQNCV